LRNVSKRLHIVKVYFIRDNYLKNEESVAVIKALMYSSGWLPENSGIIENAELSVNQHNHSALFNRRINTAGIV